MDNSVVIAGGEGDIRGLNGNRKNTINIKLKIMTMLGIVIIMTMLQTLTFLLYL